jgi:hypothetical protein
MKELFEEKMKVVLNLIRTNSTGDDAMKISQAACNLAQARLAFVPENSFMQEPETNTGTKTVKKLGVGA